MRNSQKDFFEKYMNNKQKGNLGENIAEVYLKMKGYQILERNFYVKGGEIDIIASKDDEIAIIEVKTRKNDAYGQAKDAVTYYKKKSLIFAARCYIHQNHLYDKKVRFDVIEVYLSKFKINHIKDAFEIS